MKVRTKVVKKSPGSLKQCAQVHYYENQEDTNVRFEVIANGFESLYRIENSAE